MRNMFRYGSLILMTILVVLFFVPYLFYTGSFLFAFVVSTLWIVFVAWEMLEYLNGPKKSK